VVVVSVGRLLGLVQTVGLALLLGSYSLQLPCQVTIMIWPLPTPKVLSYGPTFFFSFLFSFDIYVAPGWFGS
jgi:hypothetical protein